MQDNFSNIWKTTEVGQIFVFLLIGIWLFILDEKEYINLKIYHDHSIMCIMHSKSNIS